MKILISGDSHVGSLRRAYVASNSDKHSFDFKALGTGRIMPSNFFIEHGSYVEITDKTFRNNFKRFPPENHTYNMIGLTAPYHTARIWRQSFWSEYKPWRIRGNNHLLSNNMVSRFIQADVHYIFKLIESIKRAVPIFIIEAPRPYRHHEAVIRNGVELVSYLDGEYRNYVSTRIDSLGLPVIKVDESWIDHDGFMLDRFRSENKTDPHHGSIEYGELMLKKVLRFLNDLDNPDARN